MAQFSNCLSIISRMSERDQDDLVARLDELQAQGVPAEKAQIQAAIDVLMRAQADAAGIRRSAARGDGGADPARHITKADTERAHRHVKFLSTMAAGPYKPWFSGLVDDDIKDIAGMPLSRAPSASELVAALSSLRPVAEHYAMHGGGRRAIEEFDRAIGGVTSVDAKRSAARDVTETPEFKRWSGGAPLVRLGESHEYRSGQPVVVEALHGTTNSDLTAFKRERASIESDWGAGFYASNAPDDVAMNYANNDGADLTQRIELLAERLASNEFDDDMEAAREEAKKRLTQESPNTMKLYVRMSNPAVVGGAGETFLDYNEEYNEETDEYNEPTGALVGFVDALRDAVNGFDESDADKAMAAVWDRVSDNSGIGLSDLVVALKSADGVAYATDDDGNIAASEIIRRALEGAGFDGIIDATVSSKFDGMKGMDGDTVHFIAFEPTQLKSATGNRGTFDPADADITRSVSRDTYAWRESIDTSVGPLLQGDDFYLLPQREITQDDFGDEGFAANGLMGHAERAVPGTRTIAYRIVGDSGIIGTLVSDVDPAGVLRSVHDIEITDRRGGIGSKIVATIAANTQSPIKIQDITDEADPFWTRIGVGYKDQYGDAFLDWEDVAQYLGARRAAQVDPDAAPAAGRDRGLQEGSYDLGDLSDEEAAEFFKFSKPRATETTAFKKWFGDSKVVDAKGGPLVVYHGGASITIFNQPDEGGTFFTSSKTIAAEYRDRANGDRAVTPAYLSIQNPLIVNSDGDFWDDISVSSIDIDQAGRRRLFPGAMSSVYTTEDIVAAARKLGDHDGVIFKGVKDAPVGRARRSDVYAVFRPEQIKAATGNSGAFSPDDPDITRSIARPAFYSQLQRAIEQVPDRLATMAAPQWKLWLDANASKLGVKKDEIEWSGVREYLTLRGKDKVSRDELVAYLADSGVRVQEVVLGNQSDRQKLSNEYDRAVAASDAAGGAMNPTYIESLAPGDRKPEEQALLDAWNRVNENPDESWLPEAGNPKYGQYTVPGGENYREVLITLPSVGDEDGPAVKRLRSAKTEEEYNAARNEIDKARAQQYKSSHWGAPNVLAHIRVDDRVDADGARVLFIGELQSDWGQQAKKDGIRSNYKAEDVELLPADDPESAQPEFFWHFKVPGNVLQIPKSKYATSAEARDYIVREKPVNPSGVPAAPFISDTKAWSALALKRAIMMAVEGGYDKIAIITGDQAADLYDLSKQVKSIKGHPLESGDLQVQTYLLGGEPGPDFIVKDEQELADKIGKEAAEKLMAKFESGPDTHDGAQEISGLELKIGGEGMRAFYDQIIPQVARDVLKKLGGGQLTTVSFAQEKADRQRRHALIRERRDLGVDANGTPEWQQLTDEIDRLAALETGAAKDGAGEQPGFAITDAMREKVTSGVPLFSKGRTTGDYGREYTPQQLAMFKNTGRTVEKQSLVARVKEIRKDIWKKMAQGIVDQFRPIKDLGGDAYTLARLSKGSSGAFEALLNYGKLSIVDGAYDADMSGGFIKTVGEPLGAELEDWAWYVAANRAELLSAEDRENLFTPEDIAAGKSLATGQMDRDYVMLDGTVTRDRAKAYADSTKKFNAFNKNVLDIAEQSGLIDGESRQFWENEFYVPFYRVSDQDGEFMGAKIKGGLARQRAFQELKGGSQKLNSDLLANAMQNWAHLIDASAKNRAAKATLEAAERVGIAMESDQETVRQLGKSIGGKGGTVWFMDGGQQRHFLVGDPHLLVAINSLEYAGMRGPLMDALSTTKHWLTIGVTASPAFKVRNLIRDSLQAISVSDLSYNPLANLRDGIKASDRESQTYVSALASGGLIRFGTMLESNGAERVRRLVQKGVKPETILDSDDKLKAFYGKVIEPVVDAYNELGNRGEEINRAALFAQLKRQGVNQAEAALLSRDLMDFSMQGTWSSIRFLTQVVPFLNARLQGLYKLGRGASENPQKFAITTGAVALASIALLAAYHDDEDWKKREDWDRDVNWWFKVGGVAYRIPKPFEIGAIGTLAERGVELFVNDEFTLKRFLERVKHIASDNLAMNPVPQAIKPMVDIYANKDSFSGRPIESMGMERLQAEYRYTANTSMVARAASTALNTVTRNTVGSDTFSPVQLDSLLRGYFGWLGTFIVAGADMAIRPLTNEPTRPQADYLKVVTQGIARQLPEPSSKYVSAVYDQAKILEQAYATHRQMVKEGKVEDAREFAEENREKLQRYKVVERVKQMQADINKRIREIERSEMSPEAKRDAIQKLREAQSRAAQLVY